MQNCRLFFVVVYVAVFCKEAFSLNCYSCETRGKGHCKGTKQEVCESKYEHCVRLKVDIRVEADPNTPHRFGYKGCHFFSTCPNSTGECCRVVENWLDIHKLFEDFDLFLVKYYEGKFRFGALNAIGGEICFCNGNLCNKDSSSVFVGTGWVDNFGYPDRNTEAYEGQNGDVSGGQNGDDNDGQNVEPYQYHRRSSGGSSNMKNSTIFQVIYAYLFFAIGLFFFSN